MSTFKARYTVADGYSNQSGAPHYFTITAEDLPDNEDELARFYEGSVQDHFEANIFPEADREEDFFAWAREVLESRK